MRFVLLLLIMSALSLPLPAQSRPYRATAEHPPVIARISLITPKLVLDFAPSGYFTLSAGFWFKPRWWPKDEYGDRNFHPIPQLNPRLTI